MSSFICSPKHFKSIEENTFYLFEINKRNDVHGINEYYFREFLPEIETKRQILPFDYDDKVKERINGFTDTMRDLSAMCVTLQYRHHYEGKVDSQIEAEKMGLRQKTEAKNLSMVALYKAITCMFYQIETEHLTSIRALTPEEETAIRFFETLQSELAKSIIYSLPEYDKSEWEIN